MVAKISPLFFSRILFWQLQVQNVFVHSKQSCPDSATCSIILGIFQGIVLFHMGSVIPLSSNPAQLLFFFNVKPRELIVHLCVIIDSIKPYGLVRLSNILNSTPVFPGNIFDIGAMMESKFLTLTLRTHSDFCYPWVKLHFILIVGC